MPSKPARIPRYRRHSSGQARVTLHGRDHLLGPYGSKESHKVYDRLIAEWLENRTHLRPDDEAISVNELILAYWNHARDYYGFDDTNRGDSYCLRDALRVVKALYGTTAAREFGPLALKACRRKMIEQGWSRTYTNSQVDRLRRMFRWAAEEELLPGSNYQNLQAVRGLLRGKTEARETDKVRPVAVELVEATLPRMQPTVQAMVRFQLLTGCRPDEVCRLRPIDLDMQRATCWVYRPGSDQGPHGHHKTAHHGHERLILVGPQAQQVVRPYLGTRLDAYCFSPAESERRRNALRGARGGNRLTVETKRGRPRKRRRRAPGDRYDTHSYRRAIARACRAAFPPPGELARHGNENVSQWRARLTAQQKAQLRDWWREHTWSPNQLRHTRATELRRHGLDVTKTILGHSKVETSQIYAEKDLAAAMEVVSRIG
jgi:integrase